MHNTRRVIKPRNRTHSGTMQFRARTGYGRVVLISVLGLFSSLPLSAQFFDSFDSLSFDKRGIDGWTFFSGDGSAIMNFRQSEKGLASITVDATGDREGIWWALIRRRVSARMDLRLLARPDRALRVEARIKVSDAPRRVNLHLNTQRTTDFHSHLMEFDIPDTVMWHTISMTTRGFDALPGDSVYGQLALMDWGLQKYRVLLDYFRVDIVNPDSAGPDEGVQVPYHPPLPLPGSYAHHIPVTQDAVIDRDYPDINFNTWSARNGSGPTVLLTVSGTQFVILRWDLKAFTGMKATGSGLLELTTYGLQRSPERAKDFGMVRVTEIMGGDPRWDQSEVTWNNFRRGQPVDNVFNGQMIVDIDVAERPGGKTFATISNPVLQRLIDGKTLGLVLKPLGAIQASFYALDNRKEGLSPMLHFTSDHHTTGDSHDKRN